jgi:hypothetical protein
LSSALDSFTDKLSSVIARTLSAFCMELGEPIKTVALDLHPWNGFLALAILTESEVKADELLDDPAEMAAWKHYNFGANLDDWDVDSISTEMKAIYYEIKDAHLLFQSAASAMASESVQQALSGYSLAKGFRISVADPDNNVEYYV